MKAAALSAGLTIVLTGLCAASPLGSSRYGVLLLGEGGSKDWSQTVEDVRKAFGDKVPFAFAAGEADSANMQKAVDALQDQGARMIVAVPLFLSSYSETLDQARFLLGLREKASASVLNAPHAHNDGQIQRLKIAVPLVMTKALDDHPLLVETLAARAKALSRRPDHETLVLVGAAPKDQESARDWAGVMTALAQKVRQRAGLKAAQAMAIRPEEGQDARERSRAETGRALRKLRTVGTVVVVPLELSPGAAHLELDRMVENAMVRYDGRDILPDLRIVHWAKASAEDASRLPDMRLFKDGGKGLTPPPALTFEHKLSIDAKGATKGD